MSYDWDSDGLHSDLERPVCFGGIHFTFKFSGDWDDITFGGYGNHETLRGLGLIDAVHNRVVFRNLTRRNSDGSYAEFLPFIVVTEVSFVTAKPEPWDPDLGRRGFFDFSPFRTALYRTDQPGFGILTLYLLDAAKYSGTEADFPLAIGKNSLNRDFDVRKVRVISSPPSEAITLRVGDRRPVPMSLYLDPAPLSTVHLPPGPEAHFFEGPFAVRYLSNEQFEANRVTQWNDVHLSHVRRKITDRWGKQGRGPLPFDIWLRHEDKRRRDGLSHSFLFGRRRHSGHSAPAGFRRRLPRER